MKRATSTLFVIGGFAFVGMVTLWALGRARRVAR
jgi:hypothetical protein